MKAYQTDFLRRLGLDKSARRYMRRAALGLRHVRQDRHARARIPPASTREWFTRPQHRLM
jgi:hypothetical protein